MITGLSIAGIILLLLIGAPLFVAIAAASLICFTYVSGIGPTAVFVEMYRLTSVSALIAIPLFVFVGYYLAETNLPHRLLQFFELVLGWAKAGVCFAAIIATAVFTAFSGASAVTIVAFGGLIFPALKEKEYTDRFSLGLVTVSGGPGILFPPCVAVILYAIVANVGVQGLFAACFVPALLLIAAQYFYALLVTIDKEKAQTVKREPLTLKKSIQIISNIKWELPLFFIIVLGVLMGFFTPSEAAVITVVYALVVEGLILREVPWKKVPKITVDSAKITGAILVIMGISLGFTNFLVHERIPMMVLDIMKEWIPNKLIFLLCLNLLLIVVGCVMDIFSAILVVVPLIVPLALGFGVDPIHLGAIFLVNLEIGYSTPPVGINLFIASLRFNRSVLEVFRATIPFLVFLFLVLALVTYCPKLSLWLVELLNLRVVF